MAAPLISIIVPLFDLRRTGWNALESALAQRPSGDRYEIVAVVGRTRETDARLASLLARCDTVVEIDDDAEAAGSEIGFYIAGEGAAKGELLFFVEGHTELLPGCCADIAAYFRAHPESAVAWAPRVNRNRTPLGAIIGRVNLRAEAVARRQGWFSLGANCVITRALFAGLGGFDARFFRTNENVLFARIRERRIPFGKIETPLVVHDNDIPQRFLVDLALVSGAGKFNWHEAERSDGTRDGPASTRYRLYRYVSHPLISRAAEPAFTALGHATLFAATHLTRLNLRLACALYLSAQRSFSAVGFCRARRAAARDAHDGAPASASDARCEA